MRFDKKQLYVYIFFLNSSYTFSVSNTWLSAPEGFEKQMVEAF